MRGERLMTPEDALLEQIFEQPGEHLWVLVQYKTSKDLTFKTMTLREHIEENKKNIKSGNSWWNGTIMKCGYSKEDVEEF